MGKMMYPDYSGIANTDSALTLVSGDTKMLF